MDIELVNKEPEKPSRSFEVETTKTTKVKQEESPKCQTALEKIKNVAKVLNSDATDAEVEFIERTFDSIHSPVRVRKDFEVAKDVGELARSFYGRTEAVNPGALNSAEFTVSLEDQGPIKTAKAELGVTVEDVKNSSYGTIAERVNFDVLNELRESVYHAKYELDRVSGVKDQHFDDLNESLRKVEEILNFERLDIVHSALSAAIEELESVKVEELDPENRTHLASSIHDLSCARDLVNKQGFVSVKNPVEQQIRDYVIRATKLYPKVKENVQLKTLMTKILEIEE